MSKKNVLAVLAFFICNVCYGSQIISVEETEKCTLRGLLSKTEEYVGFLTEKLNVLADDEDASYTKEYFPTYIENNIDLSQIIRFRICHEMMYIRDNIHIFHEKLSGFENLTDNLYAANYMESLLVSLSSKNSSFFHQQCSGKRWIRNHAHFNENRKFLSDLISYTAEVMSNTISSLPIDHDDLIEVINLNRSNLIAYNDFKKNMEKLQRKQNRMLERLWGSIESNASYQLPWNFIKRSLIGGYNEGYFHFDGEIAELLTELNIALPETKGLDFMTMETYYNEAIQNPIVNDIKTINTSFFQEENVLHPHHEATLGLIEKAKNAQYPPKIIKLLQDIQKSQNFFEFRDSLSRGKRLHDLTGDLKGVFSVSPDKKYRITFEISKDGGFKNINISKHYKKGRQ